MILSVNELHKLTVFTRKSSAYFGETLQSIGEISVVVIHYCIVNRRIAAFVKIVLYFFPVLL